MVVFKYPLEEQIVNLETALALRTNDLKNCRADLESELSAKGAQVAVMAGLVDEMTTFLLDHENDLISCGIGLEHDIDAFLRKEEALSPVNVLWSGEGKIDHLTEEFESTTSIEMRVLGGDMGGVCDIGGLIGDDGQEVQVIVLKRQIDGK